MMFLQGILLIVYVNNNPDVIIRNYVRAPPPLIVTQRVQTTTPHPQLNI